MWIARDRGTATRRRGGWDEHEFGRDHILVLHAAVVIVGLAAAVAWDAGGTYVYNSARRESMAHCDCFVARDFEQRVTASC